MNHLPQSPWYCNSLIAVSNFSQICEDIRSPSSTAGANDAASKLTTGVVETGGKVTAGVNDTGRHIFTQIRTDRSGEWEKKTWSKKSIGTVPVTPNGAPPSLYTPQLQLPSVEMFQQSHILIIRTKKLLSLNQANGTSKCCLYICFSLILCSSKKEKKQNLPATS